MSTNIKPNHIRITNIIYSSIIVNNQNFNRSKHNNLSFRHSLLERSLDMMIRFFGQPQFTANDYTIEGYELFLRERVDHQWVFPDDFKEFTAYETANLLVQTIRAMPRNIKFVSFNLDPDQFVDPAYQTYLPRVQEQILPLQLCVELTEHPCAPRVPNAQLVVAAEGFKSHQLAVVLDDVGTGNNTPPFAELLASSLAEYKFAIQNFRNAHEPSEIVKKLSYWHKLADIAHKRFVIEGFESKDDLTLLKDYSADLVQGYYLGRPKLMSTDSALVLPHYQR